MNELSRIQFESAQEHPDYVSGRVLHQALKHPIGNGSPGSVSKTDTKKVRII